MGSLYRFFQHMTVQGPETVLEKALFPVLLFFGWVYGALGFLRCLFYRFNILSSFKAEVPVISVGNLCIGGTGKTPVVDYLARELLANGKKTAVVSRGYGRHDIGRPKVVSKGDGPLISPEFAGDEPFLLALRNPRLTVIVAVDRKKGIEQAVKEFGAEIVILDDGFQHLAVKRDLDIVLMDAIRPFGTGKVLPAGPLREFPSALKRGNLFIFTRMKKGFMPDIVLPGEALFCSNKVSTSIYSLGGAQLDLDAIRDRRGGAFAGIADPGQFFKDLKSAGLNIVESAAFKDHSAYGNKEIAYLNEIGHRVDYLITTEKDAVKIKQENFKKDCFVVPLSMEIVEKEKLDSILARLF